MEDEKEMEREEMERMIREYIESFEDDEKRK